MRRATSPSFFFLGFEAASPAADEEDEAAAAGGSGAGAGGADGGLGAGAGAGTGVGAGAGAAAGGAAMVALLMLCGAAVAGAGAGAALVVVPPPRWMQRRHKAAGSLLPGGSERLQREQDVAMMSCGFLFFCVTAWIGPSTPLHPALVVHEPPPLPVEACSLRVGGESWARRWHKQPGRHRGGFQYSPLRHKEDLYTLSSSAGKLISARTGGGARERASLTRARANRPRCSFGPRTASSAPQKPLPKPVRPRG